MNFKKLSNLSIQSLVLVIVLVIVTAIIFIKEFLTFGFMDILFINISVTIFFIGLFFHSIFKNKNSNIFLNISTIISIILCAWVSALNYYVWTPSYLKYWERGPFSIPIFLSAAILATALLIFYLINIFSKLNIAFVNFPKKWIIIFVIISVFISFIILGNHGHRGYYLNDSNLYIYYISDFLIIASFTWLLYTEKKSNY